MVVVEKVRLLGVVPLTEFTVRKIGRLVVSTVKYGAGVALEVTWKETVLGVPVPLV
jgi:hypothetical protein